MGLYFDRIFLFLAHLLWCSFGQHILCGRRKFVCPGRACKSVGLLRLFKLQLTFWLLKADQSEKHPPRK